MNVVHTTRYVQQALAAMISFGILPFGGIAGLAGQVPGAHLIINPKEVYQTMDGFGGGIVEYDLYPAFQDADFYDKVVFDLGLNMLRIIVDSARWKPPVDLFVEGTADAPSQWIDREANEFPMEVARQFRARGATQIFATVFSPPRWMKTNHSDIYGGRLWPDAREAFAQYLAAYVRSAKEDFDVIIDALSIQNELLFVEPYASCVYNPFQLRETLRTVQRYWTAEGLDTALVVSDEMGFAERAIQYLRPIMADEELRHFHGHFSTHGWNGAQNWRKWAALTAPYGRAFWMTETSGYTPDWRGALALAENLHQTIADGNASGYIYMLVGSPEPGRFALMGGTEFTPKAHAFRHFSRMIRPGFQRIHLGGDFAGLLVSAYQQPGTGALTVVAVNMGETGIRLQLDLAGERPVLQWLTYTSTSEEAWKKSTSPGDGPILIPAQSVVSLFTVPGELTVTLPELKPANWTQPALGRTVDPQAGRAIDEGLHRATRANDVPTIKRLLEQGLDPKGVNLGGFHPIHRAGWPGHVEPIEPLLRGGADPNAPDAIGDTPIHIAAGNGHTAFITAMIASGAVVDARNFDGGTPLHRAAQAGQVATIELLLQNGADPNLTDNNGWNALHWAAVCPEPTAAEGIARLLDAGASIHTLTNQGWSALHLAAANPIDPSRRATPETVYPNVRRLALLIEAGAEVDLPDRLGRTPLHLAAMMGETDYHEDAARHPVFSYRTDAVRFLLSAGADPKATDYAGELPEDYARMEGYHDIYLLLRTWGGNREGYQVSLPADSTASSSDNKISQHSLNTQLLAAASRGDNPKVQELLDAGANPNARPFQGGGPLHMAVVGGHISVVELLLAAGADPSLRDSDGYTSVDRAIQVNRKDLENLLKTAAQ